MSLFEALGGVKQPQQPRMTWQEAMQRIRSEPETMMKEAGYSIPAGMKDAQQIINHLLQSGQVSNPRLQMAQRMMNLMRR